MKALLSSFGAAVVLVASLSGCGETREAKSSGPEDSSGAITDQEVALARVLVQQELREDRQQDAILDSASVSASDGRVKQPNTGHTCDSGRLLHIKLIGEFPHITTTGHPPTPGATSVPEDFTVHAVLLTADPNSGHVCLVGVQTGAVKPERGSTVLNIG
jgi:hypothetical protein